VKLAKTLAIVACAGLLSAGVIGSASFARAQYANSADEGGGHAAATQPDNAAATQPDKKPSGPPIDIAGCWDGSSTVGSLEDKKFGSGYGWIGMIQSGSDIEGEGDSGYEFVWDGGADWAYGPISGSVSSKGFTAIGVLHGKCKVKFVGTLGPDDNIVGTYHYTGCTVKKDDFINTKGTFNLPLNDSGCADIIP
jgi:hypothetical protein